MKASAAKARMFVRDAEKERIFKILKTAALIAEPATGILSRDYKYVLKEVGNPDRRLGVTNDLVRCNGVINYGPCTPFPINVTLVLK